MRTTHPPICLLALPQELGLFAVAESLRGVGQPNEKSVYPGFNPAGLFKEGAAIADGRTRVSGRGLGERGWKAGAGKGMPRCLSLLLPALAARLPPL